MTVTWLSSSTRRATITLIFLDPGDQQTELAYIYNLVVKAPGSFHDAVIYQMSGVKAYLETRFPRNVCLRLSVFTVFDVLSLPIRRRKQRQTSTKACSTAGTSVWC